MPVITRKPIHTIVEARREILHAVSWQVCSSLWRPPTDMYETEESFIVKVEIAGMREEDIEVAVENNILLVSGNRADTPGRKLVNQLAVLPYIMPSWTIVQAWLVLFKNRLSGGAPGLYEYIIGQSPPDWLSYGAVPIIICCVLHYYTFFFLFVSAALMSIDSNL